MEKLIESIPEKIIANTSEDGTKQYVGLCMRFSTGQNMWVVGYGSRTANNPLAGTGHTLIEAIDDFITKQKEHNKNK